MKRPWRLTPIVVLCMAVVLAGCGADGPTEEGVASYYHDSLHRRKTASGKPYDKNALTAAHRTLSFGTRVRVTNLDNGKSVEVTINDRGPYAKGRIIDLSRAAAERVGMIRAGTANVRLVIFED